MHPDFPPAAAPLEITSVVWVPASPAAVHVHLLGRWVDRPVSEPLILLVGTERRRHAFPALGAPPAGVLVAFAVPNELRARLDVDIALQIGAHELALPPAAPGRLDEAAPAEDDAEAEVIDRAVLAERRARRAELAEEGLSRRAQEAEGRAGTLEAQLGNLEERLAQAREERDELEAGLADAERRLRTAQQREYAEQQLRIEAQDELEALRRGQESEVAGLRGRLEQANRRAEEIAREVDQARRGIAEALQQAEADRAALRRAEERLAALGEDVAAGAARRELEHAVAALEARADELGSALGAERAARSRAETALEASREEAAAKVTLLEHELEERLALQARVGAQLDEVRAELERVRTETAERPGDAAAVASLNEMAVRLKDRVVDLERRRDAAEADLAQTRKALAERTLELERARIEADRARSDAQAARGEAGRHESALAQATLTIEAVRASATELQLGLDAERRERAQAEAALHEELAAARAEGRVLAHEAEMELRRALETERSAFAAQVAAIETHVAALREQVAGAAGELQTALDAERARRESAEHELTALREAGARTAREGHERLETERAAVAEAVAQLALEQGRRAALEAEVAGALAAVREVRAEDESRSARDAEVQSVVAEVLGTAASLRDAFERESRKLEGELTARVTAERRQMAEQLGAMELRVGELQAQLEGAARDLEAQLQTERTARWLAEAELARERQRSGGIDVEAERGERRRLEGELGALRVELERVRGIAEEQTARTTQAQAMISDLTVAAERLREHTAPAPAPTEGEADAAPVASPAPLAARPAPSAPDEAWLGRALSALAQRDPVAAARLLVRLLPVQGARSSAELTYDLTITEFGTYRVALRQTGATVDAVAVPGGRKDVDFHLEGPARSVVELVTGGLRRRPKGTHVEGSRRRLKRLIRDMREPVALSDLTGSRDLADPGLVLALLAAGVDPSWTAGHVFTVAWETTGARSGTWTVHVGDGFCAVADGLPEGGASATVRLAHGALVPLLAGLAAPAGGGATATGDEQAVALLRQWFDRAQGLA